MGALLVLNSRWNGFRSVTVLVNGIKADELSLGPFLWF